MTGLTQASIVARKVIRYGIFGIIFLTVGKIVLDISINVYRTVFPPAPPVPTVKFGRLPTLELPLGQPLSVTYTLETPEGDLPTLANQAKVYFMPKLNPNLLSLDVAKEKVKELGFDPEGQQVSDTIYKFRHPEYPSSLEMNIVTGTFSVVYDLNADRSAIENKPPIAEIAIKNVKDYLDSASILPEDLTGSVTHEYFKLSDGKLLSALSLSEGDVVKINLFRKNFEDIPTVTQNPNESNVWFIVGGATDKDQQIIAGEFHYYPVDESQSSTYPIKTPQEVFAELQSGKAYIANQGLVKEGENIKIRRIYLAYFDSEVPSEFLQPIYVFEGDKGLMAYIPAVTSEYYGE